MTPTTVSPRSTGSRLMRRWIIRSTASLSSASSLIVSTSRGHHLADLAAVLVRVGLREPPAAEQEARASAGACARFRARCGEAGRLRSRSRSARGRRRRRKARSRARAASSRSLRRGLRFRARRSRHRSLRPEPSFSLPRWAFPRSIRSAKRSKRRTTAIGNRQQGGLTAPFRLPHPPVFCRCVREAVAARRE